MNLKLTLFTVYIHSNIFIWILRRY